MSHTPIDIVWVILCGALVFVMQAGFMCLEVGMVRQKNGINVAIKNFVDFLICAVAFFLFGFAIMFGPSYHGWFGTDGWLLGPYTALDQSGWIYAYWWFQVVFCGVAATIVSGGCAERMRFTGYMWVSFIVSGLIYPVFGHWVWGGGYDLAPAPGWLKALGYLDFAGASVVHLVGGSATLACLILLGPRHGKYNADGSVNKIWGCNLPMSTLGVFLLWLGWLGFNAGSTLAVTNQIGMIVVNTSLAACAGALSCLFWVWYCKKRPEVEAILNGALGGLVAITAGCAYVTPGQALIIGVLAGPVVDLCGRWLDRCKIDDAVGAVPVHAGCGILGVLAVAVFAKPEFLVHGSRLEQFWVQLLGVSVCIVFTFSTAYLLFSVINRFVTRFRVSAEDEERGLNVSEHGARTLWLDLAEDMRTIEVTQDLTRRVAVEPETEVGMVARMFNRLMESLQSKTDAMAAANKELESFSYSVSHDLRAPLRGIDGFSQVLLSKYSAQLDARGQHYLLRIRVATQRMGQLIDDLLNLSRVSRHTMSYSLVNLSALAYDIAEELRASQSGRNVMFKIQPDIQVRCDAHLLQIVLQNLLANAWKFTAKHAQAIIEFGLTQQQGENVYFVRDDGAGFDMAYAGKLFGAFQRLHDETEFEGIGIGLATVQRIIHRHGGRIWAQGALEQGATFYFTLPEIYL